MGSGGEGGRDRGDSRGWDESGGGCRSEGCGGGGNCV